MPIVIENEVETIIEELKVASTVDKVNIENFKKLLKRYNDDDVISIFELSKLFERKFPSLKKDSTRKLCRYVIEERTNTKVEFKELNEEIVRKVFPKLFKLINNCMAIDTEEALKLRNTIHSVIYQLYF